jgi:hypothetical protein
VEVLPFERLRVPALVVELLNRLMLSFEKITEEQVGCSQLSILSSIVLPLSALCSLPALCSLLFALCSLLSAFNTLFPGLCVCSLLSAVCFLFFKNLFSPLYRLNFALCLILFAISSVPFACQVSIAISEGETLLFSNSRS